MRFFALMVWVLLLSLLTHAAASPSWRVPEITEVFLNPTQAADLSQWQVKPATTTIVSVPLSASELLNRVSSGAESGFSMVLNPDSPKWGRAVRIVSVEPSEKLYRLKARLRTKATATERFTFFPAPVFHFSVSHGAQRYPFVARPTFLRNDVHIDEVIELTSGYEEIELSLITAPNSKWQLSNLSLSAVREHSRYNASFTALIGLWGLTFLWGAMKAWRRSRLPTLAVGGLLALVLIGVLSSRAQVMHFFGLISDTIRAVGGQIVAGHFSTFMQGGHIGLFCLVTVASLVFRKQWQLSFGQIISGVLVLAIATEALQRHAFGRSPELQDFMFDMLGIVIGVILYAICEKLIRTLGRR